MNTPDLPNTGTYAAFSQRLDTLLMLGANRFDPSGYHYVESLLHRAQAQAASVQRYLQARIESALQVFEQRFESARSEAMSQVNTIETRFPHATEQARHYFMECDFAALRHFCERLSQQEKAQGLSALTDAIQNNVLGDDDALEENIAAGSLDALLKQQEKEVLQALGQTVTPTTASRTELKAMQLFRETWAKASGERRVTTVVEQAPRDLGPLNSQTLVVRSLTTMRELSPDYANRFVSYIDTLLWLEKSSPRIETPADKGAVGRGLPAKSGTGKAPAPTRKSRTRAAPRKRTK